MGDRIIGLRFDTQAELSLCSEAMRETFAALAAQGKTTYAKMLFPYVDAVLLREESARGCFFGTHALLWEVDPATLAECAVRGCVLAARRHSPALADPVAWLNPIAVDFECTSAAVEGFFADARRPDVRQMCVGSFARLLTGSLRPWYIRECSRRFCAFAEHSARQHGTQVLGLYGGSCVVNADADMDKLREIYFAKTGVVCQVIIGE